VNRPVSPWRVSIEDHLVRPHWRIPAQQHDVFAGDAYQARIDAVREAHRAAGVPTRWLHVYDSLVFTRAVEVPR
jgi:hypothetical protein